jgi:hypothetical protein
MATHTYTKITIMLQRVYGQQQMSLIVCLNAQSIVCFGRTSYRTLAAGRIMNGKFLATGMVLIHGIRIHQRLAASSGEP